MEIAQKEKAALLQRAVINGSEEELSKIYDALGYVEMSVPALGLACRFRGLDVVRLLVRKGASFGFPSTKEAAETYHCYIGTKKGDYRTNYSVYLLKAFGKLPMYSLAGMIMEQQMEREDGSMLSVLPDEKRADVLRFLLENREKIAFEPEELLYYAIFYRDTALVDELKRQNVKIPGKRVCIIADGAFSPSWYWDEYVALTRRLAGEEYLEVMQQLAVELDGRLFRYTEGIFDSARNHFCSGGVFEFFYAHFNTEKMNKSAVMRGLIDEGALEAFPVLEREGWLAMPKKRDEMIAYASEKKRTEIVAWLLEYKNRTADLAAEQRKAEKKLMRELNRAPDAVDALKKLWSYKKQEDGTLIITSYKGTDTEVTVPEKIGRSIVTAVGSAFSGMSGDGTPKITLPKTLQYIESCAFHRLWGLEEIQIPDGVKAIGDLAFYECERIKDITIPAQVKTIGMSAFEGCRMLEHVTISEGVEKLGSRVFWNCSSLKSITIPTTVDRISPAAFFMCSQLEEVDLSEGVREIGGCAFEGCCLLASITIPRTVAEIGDYAFDRCRELKDVQIHEGVTKIGDHAFQYCTALKYIEIPKTVESIGAYVFSDCQALVGLDIGGNVREFGGYLFNNCSALVDITVPETVEKIGDFAFRGCVSLKSITIPENVAEIGKGVFIGCGNLEEVCICGKVKKFGAEAFSDCPNLKVIKIWNAIPNRILGETFAQCRQLTVSCPRGSRTEAYCTKKGIPCMDLVSG